MALAALDSTTHSETRPVRESFLTSHHVIVALGDDFSPVIRGFARVRLVILRDHQLFRHVVINELPFANMFPLLTPVSLPYFVTEIAALLVLGVFVRTFRVQARIEFAGDADVLEFTAFPRTILTESADWRSGRMLERARWIRTIREKAAIFNRAVCRVLRGRGMSHNAFPILTSCSERTIT